MKLIRTFFLLIHFDSNLNAICHSLNYLATYINYGAINAVANYDNGNNNGTVATLAQFSLLTPLC